VRSWVAKWVEGSPLVAFFVLVFGVEWLIFLGLSPVLPPMVALFIGSWLPNATGVLVTGLAEGRPGLRELLGRAVLWRVGAKWYAIAFLGPALGCLLALSLYMLAGNSPPGFVPAGMIVPAFLLALLTGATGEELGWRGTALPRLQARWTVLTSSLVLGVVWGLYHVPSLLLSDLPLQEIPLVPFMVSAVGLTVFMSWVYNHTRGSLMMAALVHLSANFAGNVTGVFGDPSLTWWLAGMWCVVDTVVVAFDWTRFTRAPGLSSEV
jgi:membrane protease YdiL (CAAX protease family)